MKTYDNCKHLEIPEAKQNETYMIAEHRPPHRGKATCGSCANFIGGGDWNLCCTNPPEEEVGCCGHLCYEDTPACRNYIIK